MYDFNTTMTNNGDIYIYPEGDMNVPPSGKMPAGGYYFDSIIRQEPIDEDKLNPEDNIEEFGPISDEELLHFKKNHWAFSTLTSLTSKSRVLPARGEILPWFIYTALYRFSHPAVSSISRREERTI